jgi:hypothetical protein
VLRAWEVREREIQGNNFSRGLEITQNIFSVSQEPNREIDD